jgi:hypothetical protein
MTCHEICCATFSCCPCTYHDISWSRSTPMNRHDSESIRRCCVSITIEVCKGLCLLWREELTKYRVIGIESRVSIADVASQKADEALLFQIFHDSARLDWRHLIEDCILGVAGKGDAPGVHFASLTRRGACGGWARRAGGLDGVQGLGAINLTWVARCVFHQHVLQPSIPTFQSGWGSIGTSLLMIDTSDGLLLEVLVIARGSCSAKGGAADGECNRKKHRCYLHRFVPFDV